MQKLSQKDGENHMSFGEILSEWTTDYFVSLPPSDDVLRFISKVRRPNIQKGETLMIFRKS